MRAKSQEAAMALWLRVCKSSQVILLRAYQMLPLPGGGRRICAPANLQLAGGAKGANAPGQGRGS